MPDLTADRLRNLLSYDPGTGIFRWRITRGSRRAGSVAGNIRPDGYWRIMIDGRHHYLHRLAWLYVTGEWPESEIDHRDLDHGNNRFSNLRPATHGQNLANQSLPKHNTSGVKGVYWNKTKRAWQAQIQHNGKAIFIGRFDDIETAKAARDAKALEIMGEFAR